MIWDGKRQAGVDVYRAKQGAPGQLGGEYVVVYRCNGLSPSGYYDGVGPTLVGVQDSMGGCLMSPRILQEHYRPVSQKRIPEDVQKILARHIVDKE